MIFESLWPLAFLLAVPVVIILYLLVPKGKDMKISSSLLWEKLFKNQQSKTFLEKFIHNLLMYLQIVIILLLVLALMSPYFNRQGNSSGNVIFVLDTSGSMQHENSDGKTRLEEAVDEMKSYIDASSGTFSLVTNDGMGTNLLSVNSSDKNSLYKTLKQVSCSDTQGKLSEAVSTVQTLCGDDKQKKASTVILFTDGTGAESAREFTDLLSAEVRVMGEAVDNVANTFLSLAEDENGYTAAAGLVNYSDSEVNLEIGLYEKNSLVNMRTVSLKPNENSTCLFQNLKIHDNVWHTEISAVSFENGARDSLSKDNSAYTLLEEASTVHACLIGAGNTYIEKAYQAVTGQNLVKAENESSLDKQEELVRIYDADTAAKQNETVSRMVFGDKTGAVETKKNVSLLAADTAMTEGISKFAVGVNETSIFDLPKWATGFLWSGDDCAAYYGEHDGIKEVVLGFDLRESDFVLQPEFPVFMANALGFLGDSSLLARNVYEAGEKVLFHPQPDVDMEMLTADTAKAGIYEVEAGGKKESYVVRFASASQSDGRITAESFGKTETFRGQLVRKQLRNVLLILVLILLVLEWILYVRQMRYRGKFYLAVRLIMVALVLLAAFGLSVNKRSAANTTIFLVDISNSNEQNLETIDKYLTKTIDKMPKNNQYGVVTFGRNSLVEQFVTQEKHFSKIMSMPDKSATNIEEAVSRGLSMIPDNGAGRLVILTDGRETKGSIESTASALVSRNVELLSVVYDVTADKDAYIENVELPGYLYAGDSYSMTVTVESNFDTDAALQIWMGTEQKSETDVHLNKGSNQFVLKQKVSGENVESFQVRVLAKGDTCEENNTFSAYSVVDTLPKVLVISGMKEDSTLFTSMLHAMGCNYQVVSALNAPASLEEMLQYKSIILDNVHRTDLPDGFLDSVDTYVKDYGCGMICCGGEESFALGGYRDTELEKVLPVDMQLRGTNQLPELGMVMVIDHSGSMSDTADGAGATNLDLAITAANAAVRELRDKDYVGVVTFDDKYHWQVPITQADDKDEIQSKIETVQEGGGTTIKPALWSALEEIKKCPADVRHVVLLTDGEGETRAFSDIIMAYQDAGVTLSTVAVGEYSDTSLLESIAKGCGGRYYYSDISTDISKIFAQEVFLSGDTYLQNGTFALAGNSNAITKGLYADGWPPIYGYVSATPKKSANVLLASEKDDPVLSIMQYGLGHTVAWNTDVTNQWTSALAQSDDYVQLWKRMIDYSAGNTSLGEDSVDVTTFGGSTEIVYRAKDYKENTTISAIYTDPDGNTQTAKLNATAPGVYQCVIDTDMTGIYNLSVQRMEDEETTNAIMTAAVVQYSDEYKFALNNDKFCAFIKQYGKMLKPSDNFWKKLKRTASAKFELTRWLILFAIVWFVMDIAFRRFCFVPADTKAYQKIAAFFSRTGEKTSERKAEQLTKTDTKTVQEEETQKPEEPQKAQKKKTKTKKQKQPEPQALDTSALLKKKDQRNQY